MLPMENKSILILTQRLINKRWIVFCFLLNYDYCEIQLDNICVNY